MPAWVPSYEALPAGLLLEESWEKACWESFWYRALASGKRRLRVWESSVTDSMRLLDWRGVPRREGLKEWSSWPSMVVDGRRLHGIWAVIGLSIASLRPVLGRLGQTALAGSWPRLGAELAQAARG